MIERKGAFKHGEKNFRKRLGSIRNRIRMYGNEPCIRNCIDRKEAEALIDKAIDCGCTFLIQQRYTEQQKTRITMKNCLERY